MCRQGPGDLLAEVEKDRNSMELRQLLNEICDCGKCAEANSPEKRMQESSCGFRHRLDFWNRLIHSMRSMD